MPRPGVHHLELVVSSLERSLPVYRALLTPLGYTGENEIVGERGERVVDFVGPDLVSVSVREAQTHRVFDRYAPGLHHVAFAAPSREVVDERLRWARDQGLEIEDDPREWQYAAGYYAGFFHDPDGIKLEIVHVPERSEMTTTPPETPPSTPAGTTTGTSGMPWLGQMPAGARLPLPGNAEFAVYLVALILAFLVCWLADDLGSGAWLSFFQWTTIAYILSRGVAKASRVLEQ